MKDNNINEQKSTTYEQYQLQWLIDHGHSIDDLIRNLQVVWEQLQEDKEENEIVDVTTAYEVWYDSVGFKSELWVCKDEWEQNELQEEQENELEEYER